MRAFERETEAPMLGVLALAAVGVGLALVLRGRNPHRVRGKIVMITGGSRGLGLELARELGGRGARVVIVARDPDELVRAEADLVERGIEALAIGCDVTCRDEIEAAVHEVRRRWGAVDVLVNNAGAIEVGPEVEMSEEDYCAAMDVHFWAPLYATRAVLPEMRFRRQGHVVNIASVGGLVAVPHMLPYTASKHALVGLSRGYRAELARDGITVTTVIPGPFRSGGHRHAEYKGRAGAEYRWFAAVDTIPGLAASVRRVARRVANAIERGESEVVIGLQARAAILAQALAPAWFEAALSALDRVLLPRPVEAAPPVPRSWFEEDMRPG